eukprot:g1818.t1
MEDGSSSRAADAVPETPTQPPGEAPLPPPPPSRPLEEEAPGGASLGDASNAPVAPTQDIRERGVEGEEEEGGQRESCLSRGSTAKYAFSLSGDLVPVTGEGQDEDGTPNYYDWKELFPELKALVDAIPQIAAECGAVSAWKAWPEKHYDEGGSQDWKVFPFVHTFPACDESRRTWIESTCSRCPATSSLLRRVPNIRTALFSRLGGGSRISGHRGWADLANHVLRCHLPLKVPSDGPCGLWVNEEVRLHAEGEIIVFDDSKLHKAFNESSGERLVLIVDILRPPGIPLGTADGDHTPELDGFIDAFR